MGGTLAKCLFFGNLHMSVNRILTNGRCLDSHFFGTISPFFGRILAQLLRPARPGCRGVTAVKKLDMTISIRSCNFHTITISVYTITISRVKGGSCIKRQRYLVLMHMSSKGQGLMVQAFQLTLTIVRSEACAQESAPVIFFEEQT